MNDEIPTHVFAVIGDLTEEQINSVSDVLAKLGTEARFSTDFKTFDRFHTHVLQQRAWKRKNMEQS